VITAQVRPGAYYDSVILLQLQRALAALPGVRNAGVVMGTAANKDVLAQSDLLTPEAQTASAEDLIIVVAADDADRAAAALDQVDDLLMRRRGNSDSAVDAAYRPKSLVSAAQMRPATQWVLVSVPGRYAADVAHTALRLGKHVFLYSDNVSVSDEVALKETAVAQGLLVMGPDCGTAIINGVGLGFANRVRRGHIGLVGASGTGLQQVTARIHQLGGGITHALGTGGRDLSDAVKARTTRQALDLLARDPDTAVVVLIAKPPAPDVAADLLQIAQHLDKPVVIHFLGHQPAASRRSNVVFTQTLDETAALAVDLGGTSNDQRLTTNDGQPTANSQRPAANNKASEGISFAEGQRYLRGLYAGGTLAYEALLILRGYVPAVYSNTPLEPQFALAKATESREHTIVDLGEDEFTVGRLHPMLDNELRIQRLRQEAADPETAVILLDVVLGDGAHPDPAGELAPAIAAARAAATAQDRHLAVVVVVVGTDADPQDMKQQITQLRNAGAQVEQNHAVAVRRVGALVRTLDPAAPPVDLVVLHEPLRAINVGLESFTESLAAQEADVIHVDWRPPAGGDEKLTGILARMRGNR